MLISMYSNEGLLYISELGWYHEVYLSSLGNYFSSGGGYFFIMLRTINLFRLVRSNQERRELFDTSTEPGKNIHR